MKIYSKKNIDNDTVLLTQWVCVPPPGLCAVQPDPSALTGWHPGQSERKTMDVAFSAQNVQFVKTTIYNSHLNLNVRSISLFIGDTVL